MFNLSPNATYYLVVHTHTPKHHVQQNNLWSAFSEEVSVSLVPDGIVEPDQDQDTTIVDSAETGAEIMVPPGVLTEVTTVFIEAIPDPNFSLPPGFLGPASLFVNFTFDPNPDHLPPPGATIRLPLTSPLAPGTQVPLFMYDLDGGVLSDSGIMGLVDPDRNTATFVGVTDFSIFVGLSEDLEVNEIFLPFTVR